MITITIPVVIPAIIYLVFVDGCGDAWATFASWGGSEVRDGRLLRYGVAQVISLDLAVVHLR